MSDRDALVRLLARDHRCDPYDGKIGCSVCRRRADLILDAGWMPAERLAAAAALHAPVRLYPEYRFKPWCRECSTGIVTHHDDGSFTHTVDWPCPTAEALGLVDPLAKAEAATDA